LGEGLSGPSYQIAAAKVFGYLFAICAIGCTAVSIFIALSSPAAAYWRCDGMVTSNNSCVGSSSNTDSWNNHEPFYTDEPIDERGTRYGRQDIPRNVRPFREERRHRHLLDMLPIDPR
jgi:hypothetical protein